MPGARRAAALLFAYGTLMRGYGLHRGLARGATYLEDARIAGRLLSLGHYPGLIRGRGSVRGELYRIDDPELLPVLDREEGYNFDRRRSAVTLANDRRARAWVYWYRGPQHRGALIPDGDFRRAHPPGNRA